MVLLIMRGCFRAVAPESFEPDSGRAQAALPLALDPRASMCESFTPQSLCGALERGQSDNMVRMHKERKRRSCICATPQLAYSCQCHALGMRLVCVPPTCPRLRWLSAFLPDLSMTFYDVIQLSSASRIQNHERSVP
jgi:hypothetical protein